MICLLIASSTACISSHLFVVVPVVKAVVEADVPDAFVEPAEPVEDVEATEALDDSVADVEPTKALGDPV